MIRAFLTCAMGVAALACWTPTGPEGASPESRVNARPAAATMPAGPGEHRLGLGTGRDGSLYLPQAAAARTPIPLLVMMHGAGSSARNVRFTFPLAEELGIAVLALDSRGSTWDGITGSFGPDVAFLDRALRYVFERVAVNPARIAIGGFSDGASYALSLGLANGDLFTHVIAFSPGFITPATPAGRPAVFISHGTRDQVLPIDATSRRIVPRLKSAGYTVIYREFDGPHAAPPPVAREALEWFAR